VHIEGNVKRVSAKAVALRGGKVVTIASLQIDWEPEEGDVGELAQMLEEAVVVRIDPLQTSMFRERVSSDVQQVARAGERLLDELEEGDSRSQ
jgi:hypothetical protein